MENPTVGCAISWLIQPLVGGYERMVCGIFSVQAVKWNHQPKGEKDHE